MQKKKEKKKRCNWGDISKLSDKMLEYHDERWCKEVHDDQELFAMLILEGAQAGLSWNTIIEKEDNFREAFDQFDPKIVAEYGKDKIEELMNNKGIINYYGIGDEGEPKKSQESGKMLLLH